MAIGITSIFLLKSVVPSFTALTDLGIRELSAMYYFSLLLQNKVYVMSANLSLWFLNIALPRLMGLIFVWRLKTKKIFLHPIPEKESMKTSKALENRKYRFIEIIYLICFPVYYRILVRISLPNNLAALFE